MLKDFFSKGKDFEIVYRANLKTREPPEIKQVVSSKGAVEFEQAQMGQWTSIEDLEISFEDFQYITRKKPATLRSDISRWRPTNLNLKYVKDYLSSMRATTKEKNAAERRFYSVLARILKESATETVARNAVQEVPIQTSGIQVPQPREKEAYTTAEFRELIKSPKGSFSFHLRESGIERIEKGKYPGPAVREYARRLGIDLPEIPLVESPSSQMSDQQATEAVVAEETQPPEAPEPNSLAVVGLEPSPTIQQTSPEKEPSSVPQVPGLIDQTTETQKPEEPDNEQEPVKLYKAALILGRSEEDVLQLVRSGKLTTTKGPDDRIRFNPDDLIKIKTAGAADFAGRMATTITGAPLAVTESSIGEVFVAEVLQSQGGPDKEDEPTILSKMSDLARYIGEEVLPTVHRLIEKVGSGAETEALGNVAEPEVGDQEVPPLEQEDPRISKAMTSPLESGGGPSPEEQHTYQSEQPLIPEENSNSISPGYTFRDISIKYGIWTKTLKQLLIESRIHKDGKHYPADEVDNFFASRGIDPKVGGEAEAKTPGIIEGSETPISTPQTPAQESVGLESQQLEQSTEIPDQTPLQTEKSLDEEADSSDKPAMDTIHIKEIREKYRISRQKAERLLNEGGVRRQTFTHYSRKEVEEFFQRIGIKSDGDGETGRADSSIVPAENDMVLGQEKTPPQKIRTYSPEKAAEVLGVPADLVPALTETNGVQQAGGEYFADGIDWLMGELAKHKKQSSPGQTAQPAILAETAENQQTVELAENYQEIKIPEAHVELSPSSPEPADSNQENFIRLYMAAKILGRREDEVVALVRTGKIIVAGRDADDRILFNAADLRKMRANEITGVGGRRTYTINEIEELCKRDDTDPDTVVRDSKATKYADGIFDAQAIDDYRSLPLLIKPESLAASSPQINTEGCRPSPIRGYPLKTLTASLILGKGSEEVLDLVKQGKIKVVRRGKKGQLYLNAYDIRRLKAEQIGKEVGRRVYARIEVLELFDGVNSKVESCIKCSGAKTYTEGFYDAEDIDGWMQRRGQAEPKKIIADPQAQDENEKEDKSFYIAGQQDQALPDALDSDLDILDQETEIQGTEYPSEGLENSAIAERTYTLDMMGEIFGMDALQLTIALTKTGLDRKKILGTNSYPADDVDASFAGLGLKPKDPREEIPVTIEKQNPQQTKTPAGVLEQSGSVENDDLLDPENATRAVEGSIDSGQSSTDLPEDLSEADVTTPPQIAGTVVGGKRGYTRSELESVFGSTRAGTTNILNKIGPSVIGKTPEGLSLYDADEIDDRVARIKRGEIKINIRNRVGTSGGGFIGILEACMLLGRDENYVNSLVSAGKLVSRTQQIETGKPLFYRNDISTIISEESYQPQTKPPISQSAKPRAQNPLRVDRIRNSVREVEGRKVYTANEIQRLLNCSEGSVGHHIRQSRTTILGKDGIHKLYDAEPIDRYEEGRRLGRRSPKSFWTASEIMARYGQPAGTVFNILELEKISFALSGRRRVYPAAKVDESFQRRGLDPVGKNFDTEQPENMEGSHLPATDEKFYLPYDIERRYGLTSHRAHVLLEESGIVPVDIPGGGKLYPAVETDRFFETREMRPIEVDPRDRNRETALLPSIDGSGSPTKLIHSTGASPPIITAHPKTEYAQHKLPQVQQHAQQQGPARPPTFDSQKQIDTTVPKRPELPQLFTGVDLTRVVVERIVSVQREADTAEKSDDGWIAPDDIEKVIGSPWSRMKVYFAQHGLTVNEELGVKRSDMRRFIDLDVQKLSPEKAQKYKTEFKYTAVSAEPLTENVQYKQPEIPVDQQSDPAGLELGDPSLQGHVLKTEGQTSSHPAQPIPTEGDSENSIQEAAEADIPESSALEQALELPEKPAVGEQADEILEHEKDQAGEFSAQPEDDLSYYSTCLNGSVHVQKLKRIIDSKKIAEKIEGRYGDDGRVSNEDLARVALGDGEIGINDAMGDMILRSLGLPTDREKAKRVIKKYGHEPDHAVSQEISYEAPSNGGNRQEIFDGRCVYKIKDILRLGVSQEDLAVVKGDLGDSSFPGWRFAEALARKWRTNALIALGYKGQIDDIYKQIGAEKGHH